MAEEILSGWTRSAVQRTRDAVRWVEENDGGRLPPEVAGVFQGQPAILGVLLEDLEYGGAVYAALLEKHLDNAVQEVRLKGRVTGGTFKLSWQGAPTDDIGFDATADEFAAVLHQHPAIQPGDVWVRHQPGRWQIRFQGRYAGQPNDDLGLIEPWENELEGSFLSNTQPNVVIVERTLYEATGRTQLIYGVIPLGEPFPLTMGSTVGAVWFAGIGYGVVAAECLHLELTEYG